MCRLWLLLLLFYLTEVNLLYAIYRLDMEIPLVWQMLTIIYSHMNLTLACTPYNVDKYEQIKSLLLFSFVLTIKKN